MRQNFWNRQRGVHPDTVANRCGKTESGEAGSNRLSMRLAPSYGSIFGDGNRG
jgi:hypothetical protein